MGQLKWSSCFRLYNFSSHSATLMPKIISDLLLFIKNPQVNAMVAPLSPGNFFTLLLMTFALVIPYALLLESVGVGQFDNVMEDFIRDHKYLLLLLVIIMAPLLEETIFRYHLTLQPKAIWWSLALSLLMISQMWWLAAMLLLYLVVLLVLVLNKQKPPLHLVVYLSAFFFGIVHLGNYTNFDFVANLYWIPFLVGVQFALGLLLSFIRLHFGLAKAIYFHAAYNAVLVLPVVFLDGA